MLKVEKLEEFPSVKIKEYRSSSRKVLSRPLQKGSILIGLIITMVIMASLGAGMVYLTTTSTFEGLFANNNARAYYIAESGGRYASALIRQSFATGSPDLSTIPGSYSFNGDQFQITNWNQSGGGAAPVTITFSSIGTVNSGFGFLQAKRQLNYSIQAANQSGGYAGPPALPPPASSFDIPKADLNNYYSPVDSSEVDIKSNPTVDNDRALNLKSDFYTMGLKWYANSSMAQLDTIRTGNGGLLSYGVQVKIEVNNNTSLYNIIGISSRLDDTNTTSMQPDNMYGISFVQMPNPKPDTNDNDYKHAPDWYKDMIYTNPAWDVFSTSAGAGNWFVVLWKRVGGASGTHTPLAYKQLSDLDWVYDSSSNTIKNWSTIMINVEEKIAASGDPFTLGTRYNVITSYLAANSQTTVGSNTYPPVASQLYIRSTTASPQTILWSGTKFKPILWTTITGGSAGTTGTKIVADSSLTTLNFNSYTPTTTPKAREIGLHVYYDSTSAQNIFYDDFYIDLSPSTGGGTDGSGSIIVSP